MKLKHLTVSNNILQLDIRSDSNLSASSSDDVYLWNNHLRLFTPLTSKYLVLSTREIFELFRLKI